MSIKSYVHKLCLLQRAIVGFFYVKAIDFGFITIPSLDIKQCDNDIIVSLTSYGRRVRDNKVYYTLVSMLRQKIQPKRIILWLAEDEWNDETIPQRLKNIKDLGVEIRYCDDIRSFKKLIPTLQNYPQSVIVTIDDDIYYSKDMISTMIEYHSVFPHDILCYHAAKVYIEDGVPCKYKTWPDLSDSCSGMLVFPIGEGGVLYPPCSLYEDVSKKELFIKYCSTADDIWFWINGLINNSNKRFITKTGHDYSFDGLYQFFHKGSALTHDNRFECSNDTQFKNVFDYYKIKVDQKGVIRNN